MNVKKKVSVYKILIHIFFLLLSIGFVIPLITIISISLSNETDIVLSGYRLIPKNIDFNAYRFVFKNHQQLINAYKVNVVLSSVGLLIYLVMSSMCAYAISRYDFKYKSAITFYLFFTMLFNGGLVPVYILMTNFLRLKNTYAALIIPLLGNVWFVFLMRTFFQQLPGSIIESARIDGANEWLTYYKIVLPLSTPALATVGLLQLLANWNSWFPALLYIDEPRLYTLQYLLQVMLRNIQEAIRTMDNIPGGLYDAQNLPTESLRMAMCILAIGPMLFVFPFFQKYFVTGLTVGAVKG
ncbi:MAG: carbohydrate ABC transporter permease [Firmicutes bacterium]|nr:carbohydrate ABC transporter permease [Bacillota bacterium]